MTTCYLPKPHVLLAQSRQGMPWWKALAELIDNSFDAKATRVVIECSNRKVVVSDDGKGMRDVRAAVTLGDHQEHYGSGVGMYGIGLKDAWLSAGDKISIETSTGQEHQSLTLDISELDDKWNGPDAVVTKSGSAVPQGTSITLYLRSNRKLPSEDVFQKLAWVFGPAIEQGCQILWKAGNKKHPLKAAALPRFSESVSESFLVDGKQVSIEIGLLADGEKMRNGPFWFQFKHRVIMSSKLGSKEKGAYGLGGKVVLGEGWVFTKNKDALASCEDELEDAIYNRIWHLLSKAERQTLDIETQALKAQLKGMLDDAFGRAKKEKRDSTKETVGSVEPKNTGRQRRRASKTSDTTGKISSGSRRTGFQIDFSEDDEGRMGYYDHRANCVTLNIANPFVAMCKSNQNHLALYAVAVAILSEWLCKGGGSATPAMFDVEDFSTTFGTLIKSVRMPEAEVSGEAV